MLGRSCRSPRAVKVSVGLLRTGRTCLPVLAQYLAVHVGVTIRRIVDRFEAAINRTRRLFAAFATAAAIGGLVGSPAALADPQPPPPPPAPEPAPAGVPEMTEQCSGLPWMPCEEVPVWVPSPPPPDTPRAPDAP